VKFNAEISTQGRLIIYLLAAFVASNFLIRERQKAAAESFAAWTSPNGEYRHGVDFPRERINRGPNSDVGAGAPLR